MKLLKKMTIIFAVWYYATTSNPTQTYLSTASRADSCSCLREGRRWENLNAQWLELQKPDNTRNMQLAKEKEITFLIVMFSTGETLCGTWRH